MLDSDKLQVPAIARYFVGFIERRRVLALLLGLAIVAAFLPGIGRLTTNFTHRAYFFDDDPKLVQFDAFERRFGNDDAVVLAVHSPSGVFDMDSARLLNQLTDELWRVPEVIRVDSLANFNWVHARGDEIVVERFLPHDAGLSPQLLAERQRIAMAHEIIPNYLVSKNGQTALLFAHIRPGLDLAPNAKLITQAVHDLVDGAPRGDHSFYVSGGPPLSAGFAQAAQTDLGKMVPALIVVVMLILALLLRSLAGVLLPFLVAFLGIFAGLGFAGYAGIEVSNVTSSLPEIIIACAIADSVHLLVTFYRCLARGAEQASAARVSLLENFVPTVLTSSTTAVGFFSFVSASLKPLTGLGLMAGVGTIVAWLSSYLVVGSLLFILPLRTTRLAPEEAALGQKRAARYVEWVLGHRFGVLALMGVLVLAATALSAKNEVNSDPFKYFKPGFPIREANQFIEREVGGARGVELVIDAGGEDGIKDPAFLRRVEALQRWIEGIPRVTRAMSIVDVLKATHRSLNGDAPDTYVLANDRETISQELFLYTMSLPQGMDLNDRVSLKNDALRMTVLWTIPTSSEVMDQVAVIEQKAKELGLEAHATGKNLLWQSINRRVVDSFIDSFLSAAVSISLIIIVALRSVSLGILAMIPNLVPLVFTGAFLYLLGQPLDVGTVVVASVVLGIAVDDTIHILAHFKRARFSGLSPQQALVEVFAHTSPALISTTAILAAGFGVFAFATFMPNVFFGVLTAMTLVVAALIDFMLTPVLLAWSGKATEVVPARPEPSAAE
jgi:predicted RND superfamily exporter protein